MTTGLFERGGNLGLRGLAAAAACLLLTVCAGPSGEARWAKAGVDDATTSHEIDDCRAQATVASNRQQGINQDRSATLGRNWTMSNTSGLQNQTMQQQAASAGDQAFNNCMRAKGFTQKS